MGIYLSPRTANRDNLRVRGGGYISETLNPGSIPNTQLLLTQRVYFGLLGLLQGDIVTNIHVGITVAAASSTNVFAGLYDKNRNKLAASNDLTTTLDGATGVVTMALSTPYTVTADDAYYVAILFNSGTPPTVVRGSSAGGVLSGVGSGVSQFNRHQTTVTALPDPATFDSTSIAAYWGAVS